MKKQLFTFTWLSSFCFFHLLLTAWDLWWITSNSALPKINPKKIWIRSTDPNDTYTEEWVAITENFEKLALTTPSKKVQRSYFSWYWRMVQNLKKKTIFCFKNDKNLVNFDPSTKKFKKFALWLVLFVPSI